MNWFSKDNQKRTPINVCVYVCVSVIHTITARFNLCRDIDTHHQTYCDEPSEEKKNPNSIGRILKVSDIEVDVLRNDEHWMASKKATRLSRVILLTKVEPFTLYYLT